MANKKNTPVTAPKNKATTPVEAVTTPVRNTAVPPKSVAVAATPAKKSPPSYDAIAIRAYTIWQSSGGSEIENWVRAERELSAL